MKTTAVSELKASLSSYLAKVKKGQEVVVTDRGRPIAKLVPFTLQEGGITSREKLAMDGILELGRTGRASGKFLKPSPVKDPSGLLLKILLEEREESP